MTSCGFGVPLMNLLNNSINESVSFDLGDSGFEEIVLSTAFYFPAAISLPAPPAASGAGFPQGPSDPWALK
ncbi:hypothetical protein AGMMS50268_16360 [Spirochaetia bacterium]|nr:hypothetical protein AGMMS50268_16360 [Spirochaetia bacterium]